MPATAPAKSPDDHVCTLDQRYGGGVWQCRCGTFWMRMTGTLLTYAFVAPELRERLRGYQRDLQYGDYASLADAVAHAAAERRERREKEREIARVSWPLRQQAKRARWLRCIREVVLRDPCAYCGAAAVQIDHVIPRSQGGTDARRNFAAACKRCNAEKNGRTPEQWKAWRLTRGRSWPPEPSC
jgi:5-methylcytosine-specific restriction endonuclease McrA